MARARVKARAKARAPIARKVKPKPRPKRARDAKDRILRAAAELMTESGPEAMSVRAVAERAGVNKALVFYYFKSKDALLDTLLDAYYQAHAAALAKGLEGGGEFGERVLRVVDAYLDFIDIHRTFPRLVQQAVAVGGHGPRLRRIRKNLGAMLEWAAGALADFLPERGPLAPKHFFLTLAGIVITYYTYAPVFGPLWGEDAMSDRAREERREHVHWVVCAFLERLFNERGRA